MKSFLITCLLACISVARAQDTISIYYDFYGKATSYDDAFYFQQIVMDTVKHIPKRFTYLLYDAEGMPTGAFPQSTLSAKNGHFVLVNKNRMVQLNTQYSNNKKHGVTNLYYNDGKPKNEENYKEGKLNGTCTYYHPNGKISSIENYSSDSLISFELWNEDGSKNTQQASPNSMAEFPGGMNELKKFLVDSIDYPEIALALNIQGKCYLQFTVDSTGKIADVTIKRGVADCPECDKEAVKTIKSMPDWKPAIDHNRMVNSVYNLPITFKIPQKEKKKKRRR